MTGKTGSAGVITNDAGGVGDDKEDGGATTSIFLTVSTNAPSCLVRLMPDNGFAGSWAA
ncbi:MAG TPA: hypothetical protein PK018_02995 [Candidatus Competibacter sp.]|nr:hypothetical protein [Candidatus Competibacter sp.]